MKNGITYVIADTHFGHAGMCRFLDASGNKIRPWDDVDEMNMAMIDNWNRVVRPNDKVIHVGDFTMNRRYIPLADKLNGRKILVMGNHDIFKASDYLRYFEDVKGVIVKDEVIISHFPISPMSFEYRYKINVHGHTHTHRVVTPDGQIDNRYRCACVEQINFQPIPLADLIRN
jgi:calcineurin-like phosphoesterase family protein